MASLKFLNPSTRYAEFFIDEESELVLLPTTNRAGSDNLSTISGILQGSAAFLTNDVGTFYRLRGDNTWVKIVVSGGGGGGGTNDYNQLINKPQINDITVQGNMTADDLDVAPEPTVTGEILNI